MGKLSTTATVIAALVLAFTGKAAHAQAIDMAPLCARYAGAPMMNSGGDSVVLSCTQLTEAANRIQLPKSFGSTLAPMLGMFNQINLQEHGEELTRAGMRRTAESGSTLECSLSIQGQPTKFWLTADDEGYVTEIAVTFMDLRQLADRMSKKLKVPPEFQATDEFLSFAVDVVIAKDSTFQGPNTEISRRGMTLSMRFKNIPRSGAPRIRIG